VGGLRLVFPGQSGVALRLPPHSKGGSPLSLVRFVKVAWSSVLRAFREPRAGHALAQAAGLYKSGFQLAELLVEQVIGLVNHANENVGHDFRRAELARQFRVRPSTLQRDLRKLTQAGIIKTSRNGNRTYFQANQACPVFPELRSPLIKTSGLVDVLRGELAPLAAKITLAAEYRRCPNQRIIR
jgi:DNA-binding transcriptional ArsR family regulator